MEFNVQQEINENPILAEVQGKLLDQTLKGLRKYPNTVNDEDYTLEEWLEHAQEEVVDLMVYLTASKQKLGNVGKVCLPIDQAQAIRWFLANEGNTSELIDWHAEKVGEWTGVMRHLNDLSQADLARAVLIGYHVCERKRVNS